MTPWDSCGVWIVSPSTRFNGLRMSSKSKRNRPLESPGPGVKDLRQELPSVRLGILPEAWMRLLNQNQEFSVLDSEPHQEGPWFVVQARVIRKGTHGIKGLPIPFRGDGEQLSAIKSVPIQPVLSNAPGDPKPALSIQCKAAVVGVRISHGVVRVFHRPKQTMGGMKSMSPFRDPVRRWNASIENQGAGIKGQQFIHSSGEVRVLNRFPIWKS